MILSTAVACSLLLLSAEGTPAPATPLPRSSIAAVLAHRGELGLTEAEVAELEKRDEALRKQGEDLRDQLAASSRRGAGSRQGPSPDGGSRGQSPSAAALPEDAGRGARGGWGGGRRGGGRSSADARDPAERAASLQSRLDDADTAAWLSAESVLAESRREKAREVAAKYREQLADRRAAERAGRRNGSEVK